MQAEGHALEPQSRRTDGDDLRIVPEDGYKLRCPGKARRADSQQQHERHLDAEPEALLHPMVQAGAVVEAAHRLKALTEADHGRAAEHHDPLHHAHSGDGRVSIGPGRLIEADGSHAGKSLPGQRRQTALEDPQIIIGLQFHMGKMDLKVTALGAADQQQAKADKLADDGSPSSAGDPQIQHKDQQRVQTDVQYRAAGDAHHGISGAALKTKLVIQHQR